MAHCKTRFPWCSKRTQSWSVIWSKSASSTSPTTRNFLSPSSRPPAGSVSSNKPKGTWPKCSNKNKNSHGSFLSSSITCTVRLKQCTILRPKCRRLRLTTTKWKINLLCSRVIIRPTPLMPSRLNSSNSMPPFLKNISRSKRTRVNSSGKLNRPKSHEMMLLISWLPWKKF